MKKVILGLAIAATLYACGGSATNSSDIASTDKKTEEKPEGKDISQDPAYAAGLELISKTDCLTCHKINEASTGPAYANVAAKYPNTPETIDTLAHKIIKGGSGNWGTVPMTPHPTVSLEDAKAMAKYVMLFKK